MKTPAEKKREWQRAYEKSEKRRRYLKTPAGRAMRLRAELKYRRSAHGRARKAAYDWTIKERWRAYIKSAERRKVGWGLSFEEFASFWQKPCAYCRAKIETIGLDRVQNYIGYILLNVVPCCTACNTAKHTRTVEEFTEHCRRVAMVSIFGDLL